MLFFGFVSTTTAATTATTTTTATTAATTATTLTATTTKTETAKNPRLPLVQFSLKAMDVAIVGDGGAAVICYCCD